MSFMSKVRSATSGLAHKHPLITAAMLVTAGYVTVKAVVAPKSTAVPQNPAPTSGATGILGSL
jgi:hypothetical protein